MHRLCLLFADEKHHGYSLPPAGRKRPCRQFFSSHTKIAYIALLLPYLADGNVVASEE